MKLNIEIDLDDLYSYCEESVTQVIKETVAEEIGKSVRKAVRDGISPELSRQLTTAAGVAHRRAVEHAVRTITGDA